MLRNGSVLASLVLVGCQAASSTAPSSPLPAKPVATATPTAVAAKPATAPAPATVAATATAPAPAPAPATATATVAATDPPAPPAPFVLRYACDDKYDENPTCRPTNPAWTAWLATLQLSPAAPNLLSLQGGGPSGAEWNPNAPLVAFVASAESERARLKAGKTTLAPVARFGDYDVFLLPLKTWNALARPARAGDLPADAELGPIMVVELRALGPNGELAHGAFAFSSGE